MSRFVRSASFLFVLFLVCAAVSTAVAQEEGVAPPSLVVGEPAGTPLSGEALDTETERVSGLVRCPVCQGLSVNDSPAPMAVKMKKQVRE
ncbi:MAG: cytochrome c-type biogenesis protein CcmH, partial [Thermoanaerobaculia bacterium]|nr:cytochrome c-type biogenesis protein CcmH [Thermoanaerobaculia bacterium]